MGQSNSEASVFHSIHSLIQFVFGCTLQKIPRRTRSVCSCIPDNSFTCHDGEVDKVVPEHCEDRAVGELIFAQPIIGLLEATHANLRNSLHTAGASRENEFVIQGTVIQGKRIRAEVCAGKPQADDGVTSRPKKHHSRCSRPGCWYCSRTSRALTAHFS